MPYVYRYIDLDKREVVYIGKVTKDKDFGTDPLLVRHKQHTREEWYKGAEQNIVMQFMEVDSNTDADIFETWLINYYDTGQLKNKGKTGWGKSALDLRDCFFGRWRTFEKEHECGSEYDCYSLVNVLYKATDDLTNNLDSSLEHLSDGIRELAKQRIKIKILSAFNEQAEFRRQPMEEDTIDRLESNA